MRSWTQLNPQQTRAGLQPFGLYATEWVANGGTPGRLAAKTQALYEDLLVGPLAGFHDCALSAITPADVRTWYARTRKVLAKAVKNRPGATGEARQHLVCPHPQGTGEGREEPARCHRRGPPPPGVQPSPHHPHAAVKDRVISENPCQIDRAGQVNDPERPYLSPENLVAIVTAMPEKWHLPVRVAFGAHLRVGELVALQRGDYANGALRVERQHIYVRGHGSIALTRRGGTHGGAPGQHRRGG